MHATVSHRGRPRRSPGPAGSSPARPPSRSYLGGDRVPLDIEARHLEAVERHTPTQLDQGHLEIARSLRALVSGAGSVGVRSYPA
jgi:hypothetical protein